MNTNHESQSHIEKTEQRQNIIKAAQLQFSFAQAWNLYKADKTPSNAREVVSAGDALLDVQKALGGKAMGSLGPSQVKLRQDYAKETVAKDSATLKRSDDSPFPSYTNAKGQKVTKIG